MFGEREPDSLDESQLGELNRDQLFGGGHGFFTVFADHPCQAHGHSEYRQKADPYAFG